MTDAFSNLKTGIDGFNVSLKRGTGLATYAHGLAETLLAGGASVEFVFDVRADGGDPLLREVETVETRSPAESKWTRRRRVAAAACRAIGGVSAAPLPDKAAVLRQASGNPLPDSAKLSTASNLLDASELLFRRFGRFARVRAATSPAIFHWTSPVPVVAVDALNIYTIHDLVPLRLPQSTLDDKSVYLKILRQIVRDADYVLTVSDHSRKDIISLLNMPAEKVSTVYPVVDATETLTESEQDARAFVERAYSLEWGSYFLYFGAVEPKKNVGRLLEAYAGAGLAEPLVMISSLAWMTDKELRLLAPYADAGGTIPSPLARQVRHIDYLPRRDLHRLIRGARAVLFPSIYEGFGLPAAEAMALGAPLLAAKGHALEEVAGAAACLVEPLDVRDIQAGLTRLSTNADYRRELAAKGPAATARFSRESQFRSLSAVYERLMRRG